MSNRKTLIEQFDTLDSDSSGQIDVAELFKFLSVQDQEAVKNILLAMDRDLDGHFAGLIRPVWFWYSSFFEPIGVCDAASRPGASLLSVLCVAGLLVRLQHPFDSGERPPPCPTDPKADARGLPL